MTTIYSLQHKHLPGTITEPLLKDPPTNTKHAFKSTTPANSQECAKRPDEISQLDYEDQGGRQIPEQPTM